MTNAPAFPFVAEDETGMMINMGITMRDYFAAAALPMAIKQMDEVGSSNGINHAATWAYCYADAMLRERQKENLND